MNGPGRKAVLPDGNWRRPEMVDASGLVVNAVSQDGRESASFDFGGLPGPVEFRRELVAAFAGNIRTRWHSPESWRKHAAVVREFLEFAAEQQPAVTAVDEITAKVWEDWKTTEWRRSLRTTLRCTATLTGSARDAMDVVHRGYQPQPLATYSPADIKALRQAATATVRAACLRIEANLALLERWRAGGVGAGVGRGGDGAAAGPSGPHRRRPALPRRQDARPSRLGAVRQRGHVRRLGPAVPNHGRDGRGGLADDLRRGLEPVGTADDAAT
jgi:hypothetical protein